MPRFDGTGPCGKGPKSGRGLGNCPGANQSGEMSGINRSGRRCGLGQGFGRGKCPLTQNDSLLLAEDVNELKKKIQALEAELSLAKEKLVKGE